MAVGQSYPGEDIYFSFKKRVSVGVYRNLDTYYADIYVYVNNGSNIIKFSKNVKTGYTLLTRVSATEYAFFLTSENSELLNIGTANVSFDFVESSLVSDTRLNRKSTITALQLSYNPISPER